MWKRVRDEENNIQTFTRINEGVEQIITAPITIAKSRYEIINILSVSGGFGIIYKAIDKRLNNREVLIKARRYDTETELFLYPYDSSRKKKIEKIRYEMNFEYQTLIRFKTGQESRMPNVNDIVQGFCPMIYGPHKSSDGEVFYCEDETLVHNEPYIVMQMIDGQNMGDYLDRGIDAIMKERGYNSYHQWERAVLEYAKELVTILEGFHTPKKVNNNMYYYIYQDLKPDNIMITSHKFITLLDFGGITLVKVNEDGSTNSNINRKGSPGLGTFGYQAPEAADFTQIDKLDKRVDVYTLGATIYHLLTGERLTQILDDKNMRIPVEKLRTKYTNETYELVKQCTELDRNKRFASMGEVREKLLRKCFKAVKDAL